MTTRNDVLSTLEWALRRAMDRLESASVGRECKIEDGHEEILKILRQNGLSYSDDGRLQGPGIDTRRVALTPEGVGVYGVFKDLSLDFDAFKSACVGMLESSVKEALPPELGLWVEVPTSFVDACEEKGVEPGRFLSAFMVDCMNTLPEPTASGVAAAQGEGGEG